MDNLKKSESSGDDLWLDDILEPQNVDEELGPDEDAIIFAGLTTPTDEELDRFLAELKAEDWANETLVQPVITGYSEPVDKEALMNAATIVLPSVEGQFPQETPPEQSSDSFFLDQEFRDALGEDLPPEDSLLFPGAMEMLDPEEPLESPEPQEPEEPAPEEEPEEPEVVEKKVFPQKRRPWRKKGYGFFGIPHILATFVWLGLAVVIGTSLGNILWMMAADVLAFNQVPKTVTITITEEDTLDTIAEQLHEQELIRFPWLFKLFAEFTGKAEDIAPGSFVLNKPGDDGSVSQIVYDYNALLNSMRYYGPAREIVEGLLIPEGHTCAQIFQLLEEQGVCTVEALEEYAANGELADYWFLKDVKRGDKYCLEGYLFPDTYDFYKDDDPQRVLEKMLDAFDARFTAKMHENLLNINEIYASRLRSAGYSEEYVAEHPITIRELVIIASMIQKESATSDENYIISSVIYNRLVSPDFPCLQIDATVVYAWGGGIEEVLYEHMQIDDPHNTYLYEGLPIGPIANPGRDALYAAMSPTETDVPYYYYVLNPETYRHEFFSTYEAFEEYLHSIGYYDE